MKASMTLLSLAAIASAASNNLAARNGTANAALAAESSCPGTTELPTITVSIAPCTEATSTVTVCPEASKTAGGAGAPGSPAVTGAPVPSGAGDAGVALVTVFTTVYETFCPAGLTSKTYTLTKTCDAAPCVVVPDETPAGFTVTVATCTTCGDKPVTATLTCPDDDHKTLYETQTQTVTCTEEACQVPTPAPAASTGVPVGPAPVVPVPAQTTATTITTSVSKGSGYATGTGSGNYTVPVNPTSPVVSSGIKTVASFGAAPLLVLLGALLL